MMRKLVLSLTLLANTLSSCSPQHNKNAPSTKNLIQYVNPMIGTGGHGHTHPSALAPSGMAQLGPSQYIQGWDWTSGYHYSDSIILGFSHKHLSGTGIGDLGDILVQATSGTLDLSQGRDAYHSTFSHANETASPGYYQVKLDRHQINVELTASERVGFHRYTFPREGEAHILIDLVYGIGWDSPTEASLKVLDAHTIVGYRRSTGWAKDQIQYFAAVFEKPFLTAKLYSKHQLTNKQDLKGKALHAVLDYEIQENEQVQMKVGLSSVSYENALENIRQEVPSWDFEQTRQTTEAKWNYELNKIQIESEQEEVKEIFYTALYHTLFAPTIASDINGQYRGTDQQVHDAKERTSYTLFSLWDTYRTLHPLYTIYQPEKVSAMVTSLIESYEQSGLLPVWQLEKNETNTMIGYHAVSVIVDAYLKGFDMDAEKAYAAVRASAMQDRPDLNQLREKGFIPADSQNESVALLLEYAVDDWAIAQMAKKMGKMDDYEYFSQRALNFKNIFDASTGFFRGKLNDGSWRAPFDPKRSEHRNDDYCEGNGWQYLWLTPQHPSRLIALLGGDSAFVDKLDQLFNEESIITGSEESPDISGLIGQYAHGNEPGHHTAYLYSYAGQPWKTQGRVRHIMETQYRNEVDGYAGNEDCGQMSAWYVMSALGIYPVNPASGIYTFGSPLIDHAVLQLPNGKQMEWVVTNNSKENVYLQSVVLNGEKLNRSYVTHRELTQGGELHLEMGSLPNVSWAIAPENRPLEVLD